MDVQLSESIIDAGLVNPPNTTLVPASTFTLTPSESVTLHFGIDRLTTTITNPVSVTVQYWVVDGVNSCYQNYTRAFNL